MAKRKAPSLSDFIGMGGHQFPGSLAESANQPSDMYSLPVDSLVRGRYQPRLAPEQEDLNELEQSIRELGLIEPIVVRPLKRKGQYEILAGDRRWRAARSAGLTEVPVIVHDVDDRTAAVIALVENLQRKDLNPIEEAQAMRCLMEDFGLSQEQVAKSVGRSQSAVSKIVGLLELDSDVQAHLRQGRLDPGHGKVLLNLDVSMQRLLALSAVEKGWSVRELERQKAALLAKTAREKRLPPRRDPDIVRLENRMQEWFGARVRFKYNPASGRGQIEIGFTSMDECNGILERIGLLQDCKS
jgi:ParB family chromosome partitioning protein